MKKKEKLMRALTLADEEFIAEAAPHGKTSKAKPKKNYLKWGIIAACFCCTLTALSLFLFVPFYAYPPDVSAYADSEYYPVIQKLNAITYTKPPYKNNFERFFAGIDIFDYKADSWTGDVEEDYYLDYYDEAVSGADGTKEESQKYQEVTDNQVVGVTEADIIKRTDRYFYYLNKNENKDILYVYSIEGENSKMVGSYRLQSVNNHAVLEFYLSADCKTVTVIAQKYGGDEIRKTVLISLDVSDPTNIFEKDRVAITGNYISSRLANGKLLLLTEFYVGRDPDFSDESAFLPQITTSDGTEAVPMEGIISPETLTTSTYTVICKLDQTTLAVEGTSAFLSYSQEVYVSADNIYATRQYAQKNDLGDGWTNSQSLTEISALSYSGEMAYLGSVTVEGYVKDQYSMDEYNGILRVVTTTDLMQYRDSWSWFNEDMLTEVDTSAGGTSANLYCIDLADWEIVASVIGFAPEGESVRSVRFDGDSAYVCTAVQVTDPVFFFDLSDLNHITYKDTGTIEGFSTSLVNLENGFLLGIGVGSSWGTLKIEVYEETEDGVVSVCKYELENVYFSDDYKAYLIDRENSFVGLGVTSRFNQYSNYILLHFDKGELNKLVDVPLSGENSLKRAVYVDGYLYLFGGDDFIVETVYTE